MEHRSCLLVFLISSNITIMLALEDSALYRNPTDDFSVGDFKRNPFHYLWVKKITSSMVEDQFGCTSLCVVEPKCYSFNMAAYPDSKGLYLCELLANGKYRETQKFHANATFHHYSPRSPCENDPCKNGAVCVPEYELNSYRCRCKLGFCGSNCEHGGTGNKTCSDIKLCNSKAPSGSYVIDPDGEGGVSPFTVGCDMTDKNKAGVTVISHDSEDRTLVNGFSARGTYLRNVTYTQADQLQLERLTASSAPCEQFIKYECEGSVLLYNGDMHGWWVSRDGKKMTYWGGVDSVPYKCACGLSNSCADVNFGCNCDKNDYVQREDSGLLTQKSDLPVMQLRFGDTSGSSQRGYHTLGKLKCYGVI